MVPPFQKLLVVALKPEWGFLKQHLSFKKINCSVPLYQISDYPHTALLQTGVGLARSHETFCQFLQHFSCSSVLHFGCAGGLDSQLKTGDVFIAKEIKSDGESLKINSVLSSDFENFSLSLQNSQHRISYGSLLSSRVVLKNQKEKTQASRSFSAQVVDMESFSIAKACQNSQIDYCSVRGIFDEVTEDLTDLGEPYSDAGDLSGKRLAQNLIKSPKLILQLPRLQKKSQRVNQALWPFIFWYLNSFNHQ